MLELSPLETATNASASRIPASSRMSRSNPRPTTVRAPSPGGYVKKASARLSMTVTSWGGSACNSWRDSSEPTRPHPMITTRIRLRSVPHAEARIRAVATQTDGTSGGPVQFLKRLVVGRALASNKAEHQLLPKFLALPVFSSDPLSSVAYATEEMMLVLALAGAAALGYKIPIAIAIALLLTIVVTSYRQTVK